jgi:hypothetical protein
VKRVRRFARILGECIVVVERISEGGAAMIELTEQQIHELEKPETTPPQVVNPRTKETFVLLPVEEYQRLKDDEYDDSPWTREEIEALAWEASKHEEWEEFNKDDKEPEKP